MSGHNCTTVDVNVTRGDPNVARAGHGRDSKSASSTSCAYEAALRAAEKFFACNRRRIVLTLVQDDDCSSRRPVTFRAEKHARPIRLLKLEFEDRGQDFLEWDVVLETGQIVDCHPFQYTTWAKCRVVDPETLAPGSRPVVITSDGNRLTLNYAIAKMRKKGGAS